MSLSQGIPLASVTGNNESRDISLLIRIVSVNENNQLTFPLREVWAGRDEDGNMQYEVFRANSIYDTEDGVITLGEVNADLLEYKSLRSLQPDRVLSTDSDFSHVTQLVRDGICFWKETTDDDGQRCYVIDERVLEIIFENGAYDADIDDDEQNWGEPDPVDKPLYCSDEDEDQGGDEQHAEKEDEQEEYEQEDEEDRYEDDQRVMAIQEHTRFPRAYWNW